MKKLHKKSIRLGHYDPLGIYDEIDRHVPVKEEEPKLPREVLLLFDRLAEIGRSVKHVKSAIEFEKIGIVLDENVVLDETVMLDEDYVINKDATVNLQLPQKPKYEKAIRYTSFEVYDYIGKNYRNCMLCRIDLPFDRAIIVRGPEAPIEVHDGDNILYAPYNIAEIWDVLAPQYHNIICKSCYERLSNMILGDSLDGRPVQYESSYDVLKRMIKRERQNAFLERNGIY